MYSSSALHGSSSAQAGFHAPPPSQLDSLLGDIMVDEGRVERKLAALGQMMGSQCYVTLLVSSGGDPPDDGELDMLGRFCLAFFYPLAAAQCRYDDATLLIILGLDQMMARQALHQQLERLTRDVRDMFQRDVRVGMGSCTRDIESLMLSFQYALLALNNGEPARASTLARHPPTHAPIAAPGQGHDQLVAKVKAYIQDHHAAPDFQIGQVAAHFFLNKSYLSHLFRTHTGTTMNQYLIHVRMGKAVELFNQQFCSVAWVAERVGYQDAGYFGKSFKKQYGISPNQYIDIIWQTKNDADA